VSAETSVATLLSCSASFDSNRVMGGCSGEIESTSSGILWAGTPHVCGNMQAAIDGRPQTRVFNVLSIAAQLRIRSAYFPF